jgi:hypothetical protein
MKTLTDTPQLRAARYAAYSAGKYRFNPPPVCSANWDDQAWMNWVVFDDSSLTGFLPYTRTVCAVRNGIEAL